MQMQDLDKIISKDLVPDILRRFELKKVIDQYPYFQVGIYAYLKCLYCADDVMFAEEVKRLSIFVFDKKALFYYVLSDHYERFFEKKNNKKEIDNDRTNILLNAFFETLDDSSFSLEENEKSLNANSFSGSDYFSLLESKSMDEEQNEEIDTFSNASEDRQLSIIDDFINNSKENENIKFSFVDKESEVCDVLPEEVPDEDLSEELQDDLFFTETLATIYIKQHKYARALEIITRLNLNYPEKNIYFASQISFLEKLIINETKRKK